MITVRSQFNFFDNEKVQKAADRMKIRGLARASGFVRTTARRSIRRRKKNSFPGEPPHAHSGEIKLIFFGYDERTGTSVIGPLDFKRRHIPEVLEHGGTSTGYRRNAKTGQVERVEYQVEARPFMNPALLKAVPVFPGEFKNGLRGN